ncbi:hypothetical protein L1987_71729 [Smallanthus sonchifolius]|uniref:Uncharacterized protein n=1 Tax=Smallanthus sonchifolius TaxID=185202 RepID=A0ACB9AUL5_9ASTR|nr:hypothetical protein L1987_71729 [Smallanthus sonchifolius]
MGHLNPILRLAAMLVSHNFRVTLITPRPPVSTAESTHISAFLKLYPTINTLDFQIILYTPPNPDTTDPFFVQFEAIRRSVHLLTPLLSSTAPPLSAIVSDIAPSGGVCQVADDLAIPHYILSMTSARFTSLVLHLPYLIALGTSITGQTRFQIPGLVPFDTSTFPPPFFIPNHIFTNNILSSSLAFRKAKGILITELGNGLEGSGRRFLWVLKSRVVGKEDTEKVEELVSGSFIERTKEKGMVVKGWVDQEKILSHPAIRGFVSHCGWNSVMEAATRRIPMLAWKQIGDQKVNAGIVEMVGLGIWELELFLFW